MPASDFRIPLPPAWGPPVEHVADIPRGPTVEYGEYLAGPIAHCVECHTPMGPEGPMFDTALGQGGFEFEGPWGVSVAPNITSSEDGLADYTDDEVAAMIARRRAAGRHEDAAADALRHFARMTPDDLAAVIAYLRTLPPLPTRASRRWRGWR